ncbi:MAG: phycobiliprotein lyase [Leptolyngbyaceae cyanobacterium CSU_1_3]|nr:phycobiliprotein lyase [Leptolyngbyaceae cyanobacterium CSU_1_3]
MDIVEFFAQSAGKWSSLRTSHHPALKQQEGGKSDLQIDLLEKNDPAVIQLCELYKIDSTTALCGVQIAWNGTLEPKQQKRSGSTVLVAIANPENPKVGRLLRKVGPATEQVPGTGRYEMGSGDELTLIIEDNTMYSRERIWFESPNVRLRHNILKQSDGFGMASFCSEVRMGGAKPPTPTSDAATNS